MKIHIIGGPGSGKLGLEQGKKETLKSLSQLLKWADKYRQVNLVEIRKLLIPYSGKVIE